MCQTELKTGIVIQREACMYSFKPVWLFEQNTFLGVVHSAPSGNGSDEHTVET